MYTYHLLQDLEFHAERPFSDPLFVSGYGRVLRFTLKPGQSIEEHRAPHSPLFAVVLQGEGIFSGEDGQEQRVGPDSLVIFAPGERHAVRAPDSEVVFIAFMDPAPGTRAEKVSGRIVRASQEGPQGR